MAKNNAAKLSLSVAFCGIVSALAVVIMFGSLIPSLAYAVPAAAGIVIYIVSEQLGKKWAYLSYLTVGLLSFVLIPELEADFFFPDLFRVLPDAARRAAADQKPCASASREACGL